MALTPLEIDVIDPSGAAVANATVEVRHELTGVTASPTGYDRDGLAMADPILTDTAGAARLWLPNGIYEWRVTGAVTTNWRAFRAYAGRGREASQTSSPAAALPTTDALVFGSGGVDNLLGNLKVTVTFAHEHMADVVLTLVPPTAAVRVAVQLPVSAVDGGSAPLVGATVDVRNAVTGVAATVTDSGGTPLSTPYLTDAGGQFSGYLPPGIYEWQVATSANLSTYRAADTHTGNTLDAFPLWDGPNNAFFGMADWSFDGTVTFEYSSSGSPADVAFADGASLYMDPAEGQASDGTWTLWIAGGTPGTPGDLTSWTLEMVPV